MSRYYITHQILVDRGACNSGAGWFLRIFHITDVHERVYLNSTNLLRAYSKTEEYMPKSTGWGRGSRWIINQFLFWIFMRILEHTGYSRNSMQADYFERTVKFTKLLRAYELSPSVEAAERIVEYIVKCKEK